MIDYDFDIDLGSIFTDRPLITFGLAAISLITTVGINAIFNNKEEDNTLVIDENFIEQMKAGNINIEKLAEKYKDNVKVSDQFIEEIKTGKIVLTQQDIDQLSPIMVISFDQQPQQSPPVQTQTQMINQPQAPQQPVQPQPQVVPAQPVQFVGNPVPVQPIPVQQAIPGSPIQPQPQVAPQQSSVINGQVSPVPTM